MNVESGSGLLIAGDFNGDDHLDLAVSASSRDSSSVLILANDGHGHFTQATSSHPEGGPFVDDWVAGDFDQDGNMDLAAVNAKGTSLLFNQGEERLDQGQLLVAGVVQRALTTGDYDLDGDTDIATAGGTVDPDRESDFPDTVAVWLNDGRGSFVRASSIETEEVSFSVASADFNEDGHVDLAASHFGGSLSILINDGRGNFELGRRKTRNHQIGRLEAGDFNNDGAVDLAYTHWEGAINIWINDHNGNFDHQANQLPGEIYWQLEAGDLDSDGDLDLATAETPRTIYGLLNKGDGHFATSALVNLPITARTLVLTMGDFNSDYDLDLAAIGWRWNQVFILGNISQARTVVEERDYVLPSRLTLYQNYPNPFNSATQIDYDLPVDAKVGLAIYDLLGQKIRTLAVGPQLAGHHSIAWDGTDDAGQPVGPGVYLYWLEAGKLMEAKKLVLVK